MPETITALHEPDLAARLAFLKTPQAYGKHQPAPTCLETHMSWIFQVGHCVYKLKKPVRFSFLDFSSLQAREFYCREEIRLNSRLAPGIYQGLVALQWCNGAFSLCPEAQQPAPGQTVDWLVQMRRLPLHGMLPQRISSRHIKPADIDALVTVLGHFYRSAAPASVSENDYLARFAYEQDLNRQVLLHPRFVLRDAALAVERLAQALSLSQGGLRDRVAGQHVREGHGDLRPEHVCLLQPPVVIDCLEFNALLRQVDPFDEIAFLGLECDMLGAPWIGPHLLAGLAHVLQDTPRPALVHFYTAHRALLRARLAMAHLQDPQPRTPARWPPLAEQYIARSLAASQAVVSALHQDRLGQPWPDPAPWQA